jgi:hypothetical protein
MMVDIETCIQDKNVLIFVEISGLSETMRVGGKWTENGLEGWRMDVGVGSDCLN